MQVIERFARAGEQAGMSVDDMIRILNAGVSVETLLDLICRLQARSEETRFTRWVMWPISLTGRDNPTEAKKPRPKTYGGANID